MCDEEYFEEIVNEISAREKKRKNIIVFNAPEPKLETAEKNSEADNNFICNLFNLINPDVRPLLVHRLGISNPSKIRPVKIALNSEQDVFSILKNTNKLKNVPLYKGISVTNDKTKRQTDYFKKVTSTLDERIKNGENLRIKYVKGIPKIVENLNA